MTRPFLITGMGCSGTLFLATVLNTSFAWTVQHEAPSDNRYMLGAHPIMAAARFRENYGEVNSQLRSIAMDLRDGFHIRLFLIVRDPVDIIRSMHDGRRRQRHELERTIIEATPGIRRVVQLFLSAEEVWRFERFTTSLEYLQSMADRLGINDIPWHQIDVRRRLNVHSRGTVGPLDTWASDEQDLFEDLVGVARRQLGYGTKENSHGTTQTESNERRR